jgi:hypothetical protein
MNPGMVWRSGYRTGMDRDAVLLDRLAARAERRERYRTEAMAEWRRDS